jgi:chorismate synthase
MAGANQFGQRFCVTTFGESHGTALGAVVDGCPAGLHFDFDLLNGEMERRRPGGQSKSHDQIVSSRQEKDEVEVLSGVYEGKTLGTPIAMMVRNMDARSKDYSEIRAKSRHGHADDVWKSKFINVDHRGGGRSSGRETISRVMAGAVAQMFVRSLYPACEVFGFACQIGNIALSAEDYSFIQAGTFLPDDFIARFPSSRHPEVRQLLMDAKMEGKSYGGQAEVWVRNAPKNLGQPVFHKFKSDLAQAYMSIGATVGIEIGAGFESTHAEGSHFHAQDGSPVRYGGIRGGITTGELIISRIAFKPTSTVLDEAKKGRHDPCIVPRAIPVLEAMTWLLLAEHILWSRSDRLEFS